MHLSERAAAIISHLIFYQFHLLTNKKKNQYEPSDALHVDTPYSDKPVDTIHSVVFITSVFISLIKKQLGKSYNSGHAPYIIS